MPTGNVLGLSDYQTYAQIMQGLQQAANQSRVPGGGALEAQSSADIAALLNPPQMFQDTSQQAAELGAARGVPGSAAAYGTGLRMTDEERLKRIAMGESLLTAADARNPAAALPNLDQFSISPTQQATLTLQQQQLAQQKALTEEQIASNEYLGRLHWGTGAGAYSGVPGAGAAGNRGGTVGVAGSVNPRGYATEPDYSYTGPTGGTGATPVDWAGFDDLYNEIFGDAEVGGFEDQAGVGIDVAGEGMDYAGD